MFLFNLTKNKRHTKEEMTVNIDVKIGLRDAFIDECIMDVINKIQYQTKEIPHVNVKIYIS